MVGQVLGQVLNYASNQRRLNLQEEEMRQNQDYRDQQLDLERQRLGQYDRALDLEAERDAIAAKDNIRDEKNRKAVAGINKFEGNLEIGDLKDGGNLIQVAKNDATKAGLISGKYEDILLTQFNTLNKPPGFIFDNIRVDTVNGESFLSATGRYESGEPGVATAEGGTGADETVVRVSLDEGVDLLNERLQLDLNELDSIALSNIQNRIIGASAARDTQRDALENQSKISANIQSQLSLAQDAELEREVLGTLSRLKGDEKRQYMLTLGREILNTDDPETAERLNLLEQSIGKDDGQEGAAKEEGIVSVYENETPKQEIARLERIAAAGFISPAQESRLAELKKETSNRTIDRIESETLESLIKNTGARGDLDAFESRLERANLGLATTEENFNKAKEALTEFKARDKSKDAPLDKIKETRLERAYAQAEKRRDARRDKVEETKDKRDVFIQEKLDGRIAELEKDIERGTVKDLASSQAELDALKAEKEQLTQSGVNTKSMTTPEFKGIEEKLRKIIDPDDNISQFKDASPEFISGIVSTIDAAAESGELTFTEKQTKMAAKAFEEANIQRIEDFKNKLPPDKQIIAYAMLSVMAPDAEQRTAVANLLDITAIGGDAAGSSLDKYKATTGRMTAAAAFANAETSRLEALTNARGDASEENKAVYDKIDELGKPVDIVLSSIGADSDWVNKTDETGNRNIQEVNRLLLEINRNRNNPNYIDSSAPKRSEEMLSNLERQLVSATIAGLTDTTLFGGSSPPQLDDVNLENLFVDDPKDPKKIIYQSGSSGRKEMSFSEFKSQIGLKRIRDLAVTFAIENTEARLGQE